MIYNLLIFSRSSQCIYNCNWNKKVKNTPEELLEESKLIYGLIYSLSNMINKISSNDEFTSYQTETYKLSYFGTQTNLKFVLVKST